MSLKSIEKNIDSQRSIKLHNKSFFFFFSSGILRVCLETIFNIIFFYSFLKTFFFPNFLKFSNIFKVQVYFNIFSIKMFSKKLDNLFPVNSTDKIFLFSNKKFEVLSLFTQKIN